MVVIYHNPRCSKSRQTLAILEASSEPVEVVKYLETPPTQATLVKALEVLGRDAMLRTKDDAFKAEIKSKIDDLSDIELAELMLRNPTVIERPLVVNGNKMVMGRPPENVNDII